MINPVVHEKLRAIQGLNHYLKRCKVDARLPSSVCCSWQFVWEEIQAIKIKQRITMDKLKECLICLIQYLNCMLKKRQKL